MDIQTNIQPCLVFVKDVRVQSFHRFKVLSAVLAGKPLSPVVDPDVMVEVNLGPGGVSTRPTAVSEPFVLHLFVLFHLGLGVYIILFAPLPRRWGGGDMSLWIVGGKL